MTLFKRLFGDLFTQEAEESPMEKEVLVDEQIRPSATFLEGYQLWKEEKYHIGLLDHLNEQYIIRSSNPNAEVAFHLHDSDGSSGFYFSEEIPWTTEDYRFITHYFKEIILEEGYLLNMSQRKAVSEDGKLSQLDRFYFKLPLSSRIERPYKQSWGNISLEHKLLDDKTLYVKLMANTYSDRNFQAARDFDSLMKRLFSY